ncbi:unnamed protein product, partial [Rotaria sp. Silwood1]
KPSRLRPEVTSEEEVIFAIIDNVFDSLSQFLATQEQHGSFKIDGLNAPGIIG